MRRLPSISAFALALAAAVTVVVIGLSGSSGAPGLVDRADAAVNVRDQVLHEVDISDYGPTRHGVSYEEEEGWLLPADGRARVIDFSVYRRARYVYNLSEWIITASGRVFGRSCLDYCRVGPFIDGQSRWHYEGTERALRGLGFGVFPGALPGAHAHAFRAAYRAHAAVPKGITTFAGKRVGSFQSMSAGRYVPPRGAVFVYWRPGTAPPASVIDVRNPPPVYALVDWYVDRATGQLVGLETWGCAADHVRFCEAGRAPDAITRIVTFERLAPTPQNLAQLTGPNPPRGAR